ncbi:MAG: hypothetical protein RLO51_03030 [Thalassobaculum sp.]|uniref:hypothetical protein n=1 Tax=Thalassobaculum sp. TaxID=2022740 RepID=UPI0032EAFFE6
MTRDLALKLRLTQLVTGCVTQKALHARFKQVNPQTGYEPERAYKWVQDRAAPRDPSVFEDLARVLELPVTGETVRTCSFEEFRRLVEARHGPAPAVAPPRLPGGGAVPVPAPPAAALPGYLAGQYLVFSMAWSSLHAGRMIVGGLTLQSRPDGELLAVYAERLPGGELLLEGPLRRMGRSLGAMLRHAADEMFIFMSFRPPVAPALMLTGVMSGLAYHDADPRPIAGRVHCVRVPEMDRDALVRLTGYRDPSGEAVAGTLRQAGVAAAATGRLAETIVETIAAPAPSGLIDASAEAVHLVSGPLYDAAG